MEETPLWAGSAELSCCRIVPLKGNRQRHFDDDTAPHTHTVLAEVEDEIEYSIDNKSII